MSPTRISNIDTLSALFDRLIVEQIKRFHFEKDGLKDKVNHQDEVISSIRRRLSQLLSESIREHQYQYIGEHRTFSVEALIEELERLVLHSIRIGEADRAKFTELASRNPRLDMLVLNELLARIANERRAESKNQIDELFRTLVQDETVDNGNDLK
jgi:hypothetical protein